MIEIPPLPGVCRISVLLMGPEWAEKFHRSNTFELIHVLEGSITLAFEDGNSFQGIRGDTLFVPQNVMHRDQFDFRTDLKLLYVYFSWNASASMTESFRNDALLCAPEDTKLQVRWLFEQMRSDRGTGEADRLLENARLYTILNLFYRSRKSATLPKEPEERSRKLIRDARSYLERNYMRPIHLDDAAEHLGVSAFHLSRLFGHESGFSFYEYLTEIRMNEAKKLLRDGHCTVDEIAALTGYGTGNYFAKVFRKRTGKSPLEFRKTQ